MLLGIDQTSPAIYEGENNQNARALWPAPTMFPAVLHSVLAEARVFPAAQATGLVGADLIFREDHFDPVTRFRRGRLYRRKNVEQWRAAVHPGGEPTFSSSPTNHHSSRKDLETWESVDFRSLSNELLPSQLVIVLGSTVASTQWTIISWERTSTNEDLLSLRASRSYSSLPVLDLKDVSSDHVIRITQKFETLARDLFVATPAAIVDNCRDLCEAALLAKIQDKKPAFDQAEIGKLVAAFETAFPSEFFNVKNHSKVIQLCHSRRKTSEQVRRDVRDIVAQDAELCVLSVGAILCDLKLAHWS